MYDSENNNTYYNSSEEENNSSNENSYYESSDNNSQSYYNSDNNSNGYYNNPNNDNRKPNKNRNKAVAIVAAVCAIAVIVGLAATISLAYRNVGSGNINEFVTNSAVEETEEQGTYEAIGSTDVSNNSDSTSTGGVTVTDVSDVVDAAMPSVVAITSTTLVEYGYSQYSQDIFDYYFYGGDRDNRKQTYEEQAAGSGIIIDQTDTELLIVTNNHVIEDADSLKIQFYNQEAEAAVDGYVKGTDSNADVAVVAVKLKDIPSDVLKNIKKATLGDSDAVKVGEGVIAIGNALGYGQSVTTGVISAKDREAAIEDKTMKLLQTDAAINGGNSGGALLNSKGEVIGINVAKYSSSGSSTSASIEGMGFAIPISSVKDIISDLETKETRTKVDEDKQGYLGITLIDVPSDASEKYSIPEGAYVYSVAKNGPAAKAGIEESDVIVKFDGQTISSRDALLNMMEYYKAGEKVTVTISYRDGREYKEKDVTITLGDKSVLDELQSSQAQ